MDKAEIADGISYKFDGELVDANNRKVIIDCCIWPPSVGGDIARIELGIPNASMPIQDIKNPCQIHGKPNSGVSELWLDNVWYRDITLDLQPRRRAGSTRILLTHVGKLRLTEKLNKSGGNVQSEKLKKRIKFYLTKNAFLADDLWPFALIKRTDSQVDELFAIDIPKLGIVQFLREWVFIRSVNPDNAVVRSGFCAVVELENGTCTPEEYLSYFEDALSVISIFCRQRIAVLGWEVEYDSQCEQVWKEPLDPLTTKFASLEPKLYLVRRCLFGSLMSAATKVFYELDQETKDIFKYMTVGLVPFVNMGGSERFFRMFQALEACRVIAPKVVGDDAANATLKRVLEASKSGLDKSNAERIDGFIKMVERGPSLKWQLEWVLGKWDIRINDLWPLFGSDNLPGLKQLRDKLAHSGPTALHHQSLTVATWHLSILIERVLLSLLKIPIEDTAVAPNQLGRDEWYNQAYIVKQRKLAILNG